MCIRDRDWVSEAAATGSAEACRMRRKACRSGDAPGSGCTKYTCHAPRMRTDGSSDCRRD